MKNRLSTKTLIALVLIGVVGIAMGASTYALFQDTDISSANTLQGGTLNVTIDGVDDGVTESFNQVNAQPGDSATHNYTLQNTGSTAANHLQVNLSFVENDPTNRQAEPSSDSDLNNPLTASETAKYVEVTSLTYTDGSETQTDLLASISDGNGNGIVDLVDVQNHTALDDLTPPSANATDDVHLDMTVQIANDNDGSFTLQDENIMGDGIEVKVHFTLMQDSSQDSL